MFDTLFGEGQYGLKMLFAFIVVFGLLALALWLVRRFSGERVGNPAARGRQPRLAVIDAATVDGRRRLVLIRRDNVEHLLIIGGPTDVVIEQNILRAAAATREAPAARPPAATDPLPRRGSARRGINVAVAARTVDAAGAVARRVRSAAAAPAGSNRRKHAMVGVRPLAPPTGAAASAA